MNPAHSMREMFIIVVVVVVVIFVIVVAMPYGQ
jgi:hypothetical protein